MVASGQVFHLKLIGKLLKVYGDPDWEFVDSMGEGVPLGGRAVAADPSCIRGEG